MLQGPMHGPGGGPIVAPPGPPTAGPPHPLRIVVADVAAGPAPPGPPPPADDVVSPLVGVEISNRIRAGPSVKISTLARAIADAKSMLMPHSLT